MFEGIGLGARLAYLPLKLGSWIPTIGAIAYGLVTPIGLAIGLGVRHSYNEESAMANYVTGTFDAVSAGILLYTGREYPPARLPSFVLLPSRATAHITLSTPPRAVVELLSHEFIFNDKMRKAPLWKVLVSVGEMFLGAGLMALLGRWA